MKFVTLDAGPAGAPQPGTVHEVGEAEGSALVAGGYAVVIEAAKAVKPGKDKTNKAKNDPPASDPPVGDPAGDTPNDSPGDSTATNQDADA